MRVDDHKVKAVSEDHRKEGARRTPHSDSLSKQQTDRGVGNSLSSLDFCVKQPGRHGERG